MQTTEVRSVRVLEDVDIRAGILEAMPGRNHPFTDDLALPTFKPEFFAPVLPVIDKLAWCSSAVTHAHEYTVDRLFHALPPRARHEACPLQRPVAGPAQNPRREENLPHLAQINRARCEYGPVNHGSVEQHGSPVRN